MPQQMTDAERFARIAARDRAKWLTANGENIIIPVADFDWLLAHICELETEVWERRADLEALRHG